MNRLTSSPLGSYTYGDSAHADAATSIHIQGWTAGYDAAGNMTCRAATNATTCAGTPTGAQLSYDNEGQLATWQNTPTSPTATESFLYDGEGRRVAQVATSNGTTATIAYIGSEEEVSASGATTTTIAYYGSVALSVNGTLSYLLRDNLGSVVGSVSSSGSLSASQLYAPYGATRYSNGTLPTAKGFTGQRADALSGLYDFNARYQDPLAGQFTSADSTLAGGLNRYAYVGGNPATYVDPSGHYEEEDLNNSGGGEGDSGGAGSGSGSSGGLGDGGGAGDGALVTEPTVTADWMHPDDYDVTVDGMTTVEDTDGNVVGVYDSEGNFETTEQIETEDVNNAGTQPGEEKVDEEHQEEEEQQKLVKQAHDDRLNQPKNHRPAATVTSDLEGSDGNPINASSSSYNPQTGQPSMHAEQNFDQQVRSQYKPGSLKGQTVNMGLSQVNGQQVCESICQPVMSNLASYTGGRFVVWSALYLEDGSFVIQGPQIFEP